MKYEDVIEEHKNGLVVEFTTPTPPTANAGAPAPQASQTPAVAGQASTPAQAGQQQVQDPNAFIEWTAKLDPLALKSHGYKEGGDPEENSRILSQAFINSQNMGGQAPVAGQAQAGQAQAGQAQAGQAQAGATNV